MNNPISKERLDVPQISFVFPIIIARCWVVWMERWVKPSFLTSPIIHPSVLYRFTWSPGEDLVLTGTSARIRRSDAFFESDPSFSGYFTKSNPKSERTKNIAQYHPLFLDISQNKIRNPNELKKNRSISSSPIRV